MRWLDVALAGVIASAGCSAAAPDAAHRELPDAGSAPASRVPYHATEIALGELHACALLDDGHVKCWGSNEYGQLGLGDTVRRNDASTLGDALPTVDLGTGRRAVAIAAGRYTSCASLDDGSFKCWGWPGLTGTAGQHGDTPGSMGDALPSLDLGPGRTIRQTAIGLTRAFGVLDDGSVKEWSSDRPAEVRPASASPAVVSVAPADGSACALLADGTLALLDPMAAGGPLVAQQLMGLAMGTPIRAIGGSGATMCIALVSGGVRCAPDSLTFATSSAFAAIATTDDELACGLRDDGAVLCDGATASWWEVLTPTTSEPGALVALGQPAKAIAGGEGDLCALLADGTVKCWSDAPSPGYGLSGITTSHQDELRSGPWLPIDLGTRPGP